VTRQINQAIIPTTHSLRWSVILPIASILALFAMAGAYMIANQSTQGINTAEQNRLLQNAQSTVNRSVDIYNYLATEARRFAYTSGISSAITDSNTTLLQSQAEALLSVSDLDLLIVLNAQAQEEIGFIRTQQDSIDTFAINQGTDFSNNPLFQLSTTEDLILPTAYQRTSEGLILSLIFPIVETTNTSPLGYAITGVTLNQALNNLQTSTISDVVLYDENGQVLATTLDLQSSNSEMSLNTVTLNQLTNINQPLVIDLTLAEQPYRAVMMPFVFGDQALGYIATVQSNLIPSATVISRQTSAFTFALITGMVVFVVAIALNFITSRINRIRTTVQQLNQGDLSTRTQMGNNDEIGALAQAIDEFAESVQVRQDHLQGLLRRQRRERNYIMAIIEALPYGIIVQDTDGNITLLNKQARQWLQLGSIDLQPLISGSLGKPITQGLYTLGNPITIDHHGMMLMAEAIVLLSPTKRRVGTVISLNDITKQVQQSQAQQKFLSQLSDDVQIPLSKLAQVQSTPVKALSLELAQHVATLQKMIVNMRELTLYSQQTSQLRQNPLAVETLVWTLVNDWRQIASAAELRFDAIIEHQGDTILADESHLRLAIGNLIDNAIKYTPAGGRFTIEIKEPYKEFAQLRIRDNGLGISKEDYPHIFTPFYRGTSTLSDGTVWTVPGMGQGLTQTHQIIEAHGGQMKVKTQEGIGTAVVILLPLTSGYSYSAHLTQGTHTISDTPIALDGETELIRVADLNLDND